MDGHYTALLATAPAFAQRGAMMDPMTIDQYKAMQEQRFDEMDADHDGVVTKAELSVQIASRMGNAPPSAMVDRIFDALDGDHDGKATAAEADAAAATHFAAMDSDHDGTLTADERRAGMMKMLRR